MRTPVTVAAAVGALLLAAGCSSSSGHKHTASDPPGGSASVPTRAPAGAGTASTGPGAGGSLPAGASGGVGSLGPGGTPQPGTGGAGTPGRSTGVHGPGRVSGVLPANTRACRLLTQALAEAALRPRRPGRSTDLAGLCAYATPDGKAVVNIGDVALARGQSANSVVARELANRGRTGYRVTRVAVGGRYPGVLEDGRPYVARVVWVQRGRNLTLTVSPAGGATATRTRAVADAVARTLGPT